MSHDGFRVTFPAPVDWLQKHGAFADDQERAETLSEIPDDLGAFDALDDAGIFEALELSAPAYSEVIDPVLNPSAEVLTYAKVITYNSSFEAYPVTVTLYHPGDDEASPPSSLFSSRAPSPTPMEAIVLPDESEVSHRRLRSRYAPPPPPRRVTEERPKKQVAPVTPAPPPPPPPSPPRRAAEERKRKRVTPARSPSPPPAPPPPPSSCSPPAAAKAAAAPAAAEEEEEEEYYIDEDYEQEEELPTKPELSAYFIPGRFTGLRESYTFFHTPTMAKGYYLDRITFDNNVDDIPGYRKFEFKAGDRALRGYMIAEIGGKFSRDDMFEFIFSATDIGKNKGDYVFHRNGPSRTLQKNGRPEPVSGFFRAKLLHIEYGMVLFVAPYLREWYRVGERGYVFNPPASGK